MIHYRFLLLALRFVCFRCLLFHILQTFVGTDDIDVWCDDGFAAATATSTRRRMVMMMMMVVSR